MQGLPAPGWLPWGVEGGAQGQQLPAAAQLQPPPPALVSAAIPQQPSMAPAAGQVHRQQNVLEASVAAGMGMLAPLGQWVGLRQLPQPPPQLTGAGAESAAAAALLASPPAAAATGAAEAAGPTTLGAGAAQASATGSMPPSFTEAEVQLREAGATLLFEKVLSSTDVRGVGKAPGDRVVMPKRQAEAHMPELRSQAALELPVVDLQGQWYKLRYTFWLNSSSSGRMYVLEGTAPLMRHYRLHAGDVLLVARASDGGLLMAGRQGGQVQAKRSASDALLAGGRGGKSSSRRRTTPMPRRAASAPHLQHPWQQQPLRPVGQPQALQVAPCYGYWSGLSQPPRKDGIFRSCPLVPPSTEQVAAQQRHNWSTVVSLGGEAFQAFFDSYEAALANLAAASQQHPVRMVAVPLPSGRATQAGATMRQPATNALQQQQPPQQQQRQQQQQQQQQAAQMPQQTPASAVPSQAAGPVAAGQQPLRPVPVLLSPPSQLQLQQQPQAAQQARQPQAAAQQAQQPPVLKQPLHSSLRHQVAHQLQFQEPSQSQEPSYPQQQHPQCQLPAPGAPYTPAPALAASAEGGATPTDQMPLRAAVAGLTGSVPSLPASTHHLLPSVTHLHQQQQQQSQLVAVSNPLVSLQWRRPQTDEEEQPADAPQPPSSLSGPGSGQPPVLMPGPQQPVLAAAVAAAAEAQQAAMDISAEAAVAPIPAAPHPSAPPAIHATSRIGGGTPVQQQQQQQQLRQQQQQQWQQAAGPALPPISILLEQQGPGTLPSLLRAMPSLAAVPATSMQQPQQQQVQLQGQAAPPKPQQQQLGMPSVGTQPVPAAAQMMQHRPSDASLAAAAAAAAAASLNVAPLGEQQQQPQPQSRTLALPVVPPAQAVLGHEGPTSSVPAPLALPSMPPLVWPLAEQHLFRSHAQPHGAQTISRTMQPAPGATALQAPAPAGAVGVLPPPALRLPLAPQREVQAPTSPPATFSVVTGASTCD